MDSKIQCSAIKIMHFFATINHVFGGSSQLPNHIHPTSAKCRIIKQCVAQNLGRATKHLIDSGEKPICWLSFEFESLYVTERGSTVISMCWSSRLITFHFDSKIQWQMFVLLYGHHAGAPPSFVPPPPHLSGLYFHYLVWLLKVLYMWWLVISVKITLAQTQS